MHAMRGAALAETAATLTTIFILLLGTLQIGLVGYYQLTADGAAFLAAHESVLGLDQTAAIPTIVASPFPQIAHGSLTFQTLLPEQTQVPTNYNLSDPSNRYGGVSLTRAIHLAAAVTFSGLPGLIAFTHLGSPIVSASFIEPQMLYTAHHYNVAGTDYNSTAASIGDSPYNQTLQQGNSNVPPFTFGLHSIAWCPIPIPADLFQLQCISFGYILSLFTSTNAAPNGQVRSLGLAEYLDNSNNNSSFPNGVLGGETFAAMSCHQRYYARLLQSTFTPNAYPILSLLSGVFNYGSELGIPLNSDLSTVYSWDNTYPAGTPPASGSVNNPLNALQPLNGC